MSFNTVFQTLFSILMFFSSLFFAEGVSQSEVESDLIKIYQFHAQKHSFDVIFPR